MVMVVGSKRSVLEVGSISGKVNQQAGEQRLERDECLFDNRVGFVDEALGGI